MILHGKHISDQDHYELMAHQIAQKVEQLDRASLESTLVYLRDAVGWSDTPNIVACLYTFTKSCLDVLPIYEQHPEWITPHQLLPFVPMTEQNHRDMVTKQLTNGKKKAKRKQEVSLA